MFRSLYFISIRQLTGRSRLLIMAAVASVPILLSVVAVLNQDELNTAELDDSLLALMLGAAVLPIITLTVATAALGNDLEDRTLSNLTLTPASRWQLIMPKLASAITVAMPPILGSAVISTVLAYEGDTQVVVSVTTGVVLATLAYSSVFLWLGLTTSRSLGYGLMYIFLWEFLFTGFVSGIRFLSIRAYMLGVIHGVDEDRFADDTQIISLPVSIIVLLAVTVVFTVLTVRRLRTMDVP